MKSGMKQGNRSAGFTLIEMSIVLVIIGLIVGGVLVGQDLIRAAYVRAQITQIEKFNTAVNTFYGKYQALPGDMNATVASQYGFLARGSWPGQGDGNGVIQSYGYGLGAIPGLEVSGETAMFWSDLTYANGQNINLIEGSFTLPSQNPLYPSQPIYNTALNAWMPEAKIGGGNYIYLYSGGYSGTDGHNYFGLSVPFPISYWITYLAGYFASTPGLTVRQAYSIDSKIDDGLPQNGRVTASYLSWCTPCTPNDVLWATGASGAEGANNRYGPTTAATPGSTTTCYDNNGGSAEQQYSMEINGGAGLNCALSFQFQSGD